MKFSVSFQGFSKCCFSNFIDLTSGERSINKSFVHIFCINYRHLLDLCAMDSKDIIPENQEIIGSPYKFSPTGGLMGQ